MNGGRKLQENILISLRSPAIISFILVFPFMILELVNTGEIIVNERALKVAGIDGSELESRSLELKGISEPVLVRVMRGSLPNHLLSRHRRWHGCSYSGRVIAGVGSEQ